MKKISQSRNSFNCPRPSKLGSPRYSGLEYSYRHRKGDGDSLEISTVRYFRNLNLNSVPSGQGFIPRTVSDDLRQLSDATSKLCRFWPDLIVPVPSRNRTILVDCKNVKGNTPHYSFCLDSFRFHKLLAEKLGALILYVFPERYPGDGLRGAFVLELQDLIGKEVADSKILKEINGSSRPFALVPKVRVPRLSLVMDQILSAGGSV